MDVKIKSEKELDPGPCSSSSPSAVVTNTTTVTQDLTNGTNMTLAKESAQTTLEAKKRTKDVLPDGTSLPEDMPAVDLRIVKKERIDEEDARTDKSQSPTRESNGLHHHNSSLLEHKNQTPRDTKDSITSFVRRSCEEKSTINRQRLPETVESYPYRVPIVYPIHSPPIDYQSINSGRSPSPNSHRLEEGERSSPTSPRINQRQLYEESQWPSMERKQEVKFDEKPSNYAGFSSARSSPLRKCSPFTIISQQQEPVKTGHSSPKGSNAEKPMFVRRRLKSSERLASTEDDKEEESLWKQVQRYRYRKRPALGKLHPTQEETIFMQYNEIRERRHREGRIITRIGRPVISHGNPITDQTLTSPPVSSDHQIDSKSQVLTSASEKFMTPQQSGSGRVESYGSQASRPLVAEFPNTKGHGNSCITVSSQDIPAPIQRPPTSNSTSVDSHPDVAFDGNVERMKTPSDQAENHSTSTHVHSDYQGYSSPSAHGCTGQQPQKFHDIHGMDVRGVDARGIDARSLDARGLDARSALDCRTNLPYEDCSHNLSSYRHRPIHPIQRFHMGDNCHDNRRRRMSPCGHHCCHHKRARRTSSDGTDEYNDDNDDNHHWQYASKEKRSRPELGSSRDINDLYRRDNQTLPTQNGSQPFSPSSSDSRDNESIEYGQSQDFQPDTENQIYGENGHFSQQSSPQTHEENEKMYLQQSPFTRGDREPDDDDVICHVNGLFSLPGYRETKYDITRGELKRRTEPPETLTRVEMISYVRQAKTSGRILLDTNGITTSNRSHPTILSRVCEREAQVLACGIHKMNLEYLPLKKLVQICVDMYKSRGCDGCQDCRLKLRRRVVDVEITRNMLKELLHVFQEASAEGFLDTYELASHSFGTINLVNHLKLIDEYHKLLLLALEKE